jgi:hypothetical protein
LTQNQALAAILFHYRHVLNSLRRQSRGKRGCSPQRKCTSAA